MNREQSDGEDSAGETGTDGFVDATAEMEVELRLPLEVDMKPDRIREGVPLFPDRSGTDTGYRCLSSRNPVASRSTASRFWRWSSQARHIRSDISGTDPTPDEYRDMAAEANASSFYSQVTDPGISKSGQTIPGSRDTVGIRSFQEWSA